MSCATATSHQSARLEHQLADDLTAARSVGHYLCRGPEAKAQVEIRRPAITLHPKNRDAPSRG
jgi:hypothetical protein